MLVFRFFSLQASIFPRDLINLRDPQISISLTIF